jgi:serine/threonine protein kinase
MSPEALKSNIYSFKSDIWSLGVLLYEMLHGKAPWEPVTEKELPEKIRQSFTFNRNISEDVRDFIRKCLTYEESKRLNLVDMQNHPFILRITENDRLPPLPKKQTSCSGSEALNANKDNSSHHILENMTTELASIHHRKNPQTKPKTEKQLTAQINLMRFIFRFL